MSHRTIIIDYGLGNLFSVRRAVEICGEQDVGVSSDPDDIAKAQKIILPGVGAFQDGIDGLRTGGFVEPLLKAAGQGTPLLGICLGMQLLATTSEEFGQHAGLNLIPGAVVHIPRVRGDEKPLKTPFIGWAALQLEQESEESKGCLRNIGNRAVYLVHSFHMIPQSRDHLLATYQYGDQQITAAVRKGNITGLQFHPEKSGTAGLEILKDFLFPI